jgi:hypothetical protein
MPAWDRWNSGVPVNLRNSWFGIEKRDPLGQLLAELVGGSALGSPSELVQVQASERLEACRFAAPRQREGNKIYCESFP